jgi:vacuolar-type H+-ATPase subunit C/Vma6
MVVPIPTGIDFTSARLRARRSRLAEAERLDELCRLRSLSELSRALFGESHAGTPADLQRRLVAEQAAELRQVAAWGDGSAGRLVEWLTVRYTLENLKVLARGFVTRAPLDEVRAHLATVQGQPALDVAGMIQADGVETFAAGIPLKPLRSAVRQAAEAYHAAPSAFVIESALDHGYFTELQARLADLDDEDRAGVAELCFQEIDLFHLMLVTRGKFQYGLRPELLLPLHVPGTRLNHDRLAAMLAASDVTAAAARAVGAVVDLLPQGDVDAVTLEVLAWHRYLRLATSAFRRGLLALGVVAAYGALRRIELANLITLSEGIRVGVEADVIRRRLIPRPDLAAWLKAGPEASRV